MPHYSRAIDAPHSQWWDNCPPCVGVGYSPEIPTRSRDSPAGTGEVSNCPVGGGAVCLTTCQSSYSFSSPQLTIPKILSIVYYDGVTS